MAKNGSKVLQILIVGILGAALLIWLAPKICLMVCSRMDKAAAQKIGINVNEPPLEDADEEVEEEIQDEKAVDEDA